MLRRLPLALLLAGALSACGDEAAPEGGAAPAASPAASGAKPKGGAAAPGAAAAAAPPVDLSKRVLKDSDFIESESNRDPFRNYATELKTKGPVVAQRTVLMPNTPVVQMKLIAIITGIDQPRAMILDEKGVGHVTTRGDFVGAADVVQSGGAENLPVAINWRVDRIREGEVVLAREDPTGPNRPPLIRVIPLHAAEEDESGGLSEAKAGDEG